MVIQHVSPFVPGLVAAAVEEEEVVSEALALNAWILIIGSLLWDTDRRDGGDARLHESVGVVSAPIRYGRWKRKISRNIVEKSSV